MEDGESLAGTSLVISALGRCPRLVPVSVAPLVWSTTGDSERVCPGMRPEPGTGLGVETTGPWPTVVGGWPHWARAGPGRLAVRLSDDITSPVRPLQWKQKMETE